MTQQDCSFDIIDATTRRAKVLGNQDPSTHEFDNPPAPFIKGEEVTFTGKWPLESYLDNKKEEFTFHRADGSTITGTLIGFTADCQKPYWHKFGMPRLLIRVRICL